MKAIITTYAVIDTEKDTLLSSFPVTQQDAPTLEAQQNKARAAANKCLGAWSHQYPTRQLAVAHVERGVDGGWERIS